jgi:zinc protease
MIKSILAGALMSSLFTTAALAAAAGSPADREAIATLRSSNARLVRFLLDNGIVGLVKEDHAAPVASVQIWVGTGAIHEDALLGAGLSHYLEHMIFKGTPTRKPGDIAREISDAGGQINAYTSQDRTVFHVDLPSRQWRTGLAVLGDALMNASFPAEECEKEKSVILREMSMNRDDPDRELGKLLWQTAYTVHPYRVPVIGYKDIFQGITRDDLVAFFRRNYVPDNMIVVLVGDLNAAEVEQAVRQTFAAMPRRPRTPVVLPAEPAQQAPRFARKVLPCKTSRVHVAYHTVGLTDPEAPAVDLLAAIAGSGQSSRLARTIKEEQKLVHGIDAWSFTPKYPGLIAISASFDPDKEEAVLRAIDAQVRSWVEQPFTRDEVDKVRRMVLVGELSTLQTAHGQASSYASGELFVQDPRHSEAYLQRLQAITPADIQAVARAYLRDENKTVVVLSPSAGAAAEAAPAAAAASDVSRTPLSMGVPLLVREDHRLPFVYLCAAFRGGVLSETEQNAGINRLMSDLLVRGTGRRTAPQIAATVERLGGDLSPFSGHNSFGLQARCMAADVDTFMDVMFDCLGNAAFPADEIPALKTIQLAAIDQQYEQPFFVAQEALEQVIFQGHPYRWPPLGRRASVAALDQAALRAHFRRTVVTGNLVLSIFGDITPAAARELAEKYVRRVRRAEAPAREAVQARPTLPARVEKREPKEQAIVLIGFPGITLKDPRKDALEIVDTALSGLSSHLSDAIREQRGLAYYSGASQRIGVDPGIFTIYAGTRGDAATEVEGLMSREIARLGTEGLSAEEIARARNQIIAGHEMKLQDNMNLAMVCALNELYGLGCQYEFTTRQRLEAVTADQIRQAAAALFTANRQVISVVLPQPAAK